MSIIRYALEGNIKRFNGNLKALAIQEGRSHAGLWCGFLRDFMLYGCAFSEYLDYGFYNKTAAEKAEYFTVKDADRLYPKINPDEHKTFFTLKPNFLKNFAKYCPRGFFLPDETVTREQNIAALTDFLKKHPTFFSKPVDGHAGHNVVRRCAEEITDISAYYDELAAGRMMLDEPVVQHPELNRMNASCVNTLRIMTLGCGDESRIIFAAIRIGDGSCEADNFHRGGMGAIIDTEKGELVGNAVNKKGEWFETHPASGVKFDGFKLPNWDAARRTVLEAALVNQKIHVVGWDVALTPDGCTLIEGNRRSGFDLVQNLSRRGRKDIMRDVVAEINRKEGTHFRV